MQWYSKEKRFLTLRQGGTQTLFVNTDKIPKEKWGAPLMDEDWVVLCPALCQSILQEEWIDMPKQLKDDCRKIEVKNAGQKVAGLGKVAWHKNQEELFSLQRMSKFRLLVKVSRHCGRSISIRLCGCAKAGRRKWKRVNPHTSLSTDWMM